jgi:uncharacterized membrane protein
MQNQKSALGMDGNITALLGYIIGIVAIVLIFIEKDNKFVRFHALQSVLWAVAYVVSIIAVMIVGLIITAVLGSISSSLATVSGLLFGLLYFALIIGFLGGLIYAAIKAYGGTEFKLPFVGNLAQKWV